MADLYFDGRAVAEARSNVGDGGSPQHLRFVGICRPDGGLSLKDDNELNEGWKVAGQESAQAREGRRPWRLGFPHLPCADEDGESGRACPLGSDDHPCCAGDGGSPPQLSFIRVKLTCKGKFLI
jgi:hypothetical protein